MDVWEAIEKRRTVRVFKDGVPDALLRKVILAGSRSPSPGNFQPWEFIIVNDPVTIDKIAEQKYLMAIQSQKMDEEPALRQRNVYKNSTVVAMCYKTDGSLSHVAAWLAAQNMALALTAEGLACVMSTLRDEYKEAVKKLLGLPEGYDLATVMVMGVPESVPEKRTGGIEREDFSWLHVNKFGNPG